MANLRSVPQIRIRWHGSWYLALALITGILVTQFSESYFLWQRIVFGLLGALIFMLSMYIRQLLLNLLVVLIGVPRKNVTLYPFGEVALVPKYGTSPKREVFVALFELSSNLLIAGVFNFVYLGQSINGNPVVVVFLQELAFFWYILALLHFLPGFPLSTGRILLSILWKVTGRYRRAVRVTTWLAWGFGWLLIFGGLAVLIASRQIANGLLLVFLAWTLREAAVKSRRRATLFETLQDTPVRDIMTKEYSSIPGRLSVGQLVHDYVTVTGQDYFAVVDEGELRGVVTVRQIRNIRRRLWNDTMVGQIMIPAVKIQTVQTDQAAPFVLEVMDNRRVNETPVLDGDKFVGIAARDRLMRLARVRGILRL